MFSSFTSFLPSALHPSSPQPPENQPEIDDDDDDEEVQGKTDEQVEGKKKKDKKEKSANETFIFVRPPPAKTNHPLNLQVQLVPPHSRAPGGITPRQSIDDDAASTTSGADLSRTTSAQSEASSYSTSGYNSTASSSGYASASTTSFSSVNSVSSGRRMIIPLYNLQAHNVMTNTIVDAGTDAKIAKFTKRGLEMIDLALLEPIEVWPTPNRPHIQQQGGVRHQPSNSALHPTQSGSATPEHTPASSAVSLPSFNVHDSELGHVPPSHHPIATPTPTTPTPAAKKNTNIFGKLFSKRKEASPSLLPPGGAVDLSVAPPSKAAIGTVPSPIPEGLPPAPTSPGFAPRGHARNLSNTINNAFRRSPSPAKDVRPSTSTGASGGLTTPKRSAFSRSGGDKEEGNGYGDTLNPNPGTTSSRLSTSSRHSHHSAHESTNNGASSSQNPQQQLLLPATLGIQPTLSTPGGPLALSSLFFTSGAAPSFNSAGYPPPKHLGFGKGPALYVWVVRKWMKGGNGGLFGLSGGLREVLSGIGSAAEGEPRRSIGDAASGQNGGVTGKLEVRVEWKRGKKPKAKKDKRKEKEGDSTTNSRNPSRSASRAPENTSRTSLGQTNGNGLGAEEADENGRRKSLNRLSALSGASVSASEDLHDGEVNTGSKRGKRARSRQSLRASLNSLGGGGGAGREDDDGDESDPEDSETPWVCTLKVRRLGAAPPTPSASKIKSQKPGAQQGVGEDTSSGPLKIKVGTLSPTPHHPKVVAMLKVPWPLPDLEVERMQVRKRDVSNPTPGSAGPGSIQAATERLQGLSLTAEEIKDVICSTGMWVVVREGFGGVGRVSRKGDGWRIRA